ncbi:hypothetical protein CHU93_05995 [Sandarakinorhabdus cyanobacteriorum]|uniref:DUF177 domain-containing protein n=1 Tax=Sandarakinorhabdus cyanobacteriorum TaxID=1981098 RepID=A0A255YNX2_9SPHN|nr:DUF177 domain-containing protein [Sandarakinorhabdus cyanobacteriorum]OYQ30889.1 hypothetical protein CHU93_05995 [Sandarakinorhabdus cyanobacteriorum]
MTAPVPEFSHPLRAHEIGGTVRRVAISANDGERAALAARFDLLALTSLSASFEVKREAAGIRVTGTVTATGDQACVASGEPVPFRLKEAVALLLSDAPDGGEIELAADDLDVEPLAGDIVDLGEIAAQALALGLDPYPRRPGGVPGLLSEEEAAEARSPFAVLKGK